MISFKRINRKFVSKDDKLLEKLNQKIPLSESQKREILKYKKIAELRDAENKK